MKRSLFSPPDTFTVAPLASLLPNLGDIRKLDSLSHSLFARYERAKAGSNERAMLKLLLDWLAARKEE